MRNDERGIDGPEDLRQPTKRFALRIISLCDHLGYQGSRGIIARQLVKCGTSVGAQFREAARARSDAEFVSKVESSSQELDETMYWLELIMDGSLLRPQRLTPLLGEADEIMRILVASAVTVKRRMNRGKRKGGR